MVGRAHVRYNQISYPTGGWRLNWRAIRLQKVSHSRARWAPCHAPQPGWSRGLAVGPCYPAWVEGGLAVGRGALRQSRAWAQESQRLHSGGEHTRSHAWARPTCWSWRVSWGGRCGCASLSGFIKAGGGNIREYSSAWTLSGGRHPAGVVRTKTWLHGTI